MQTGDLLQDFAISPGNSYDGIWASGRVLTGLQQYHGNTPTSRGAWRLEVPEGGYGEDDFEDTDSLAMRSLL